MGTIMFGFCFFAPGFPSPPPLLQTASRREVCVQGRRGGVCESSSWLLVGPCASLGLACVRLSAVWDQVQSGLRGPWSMCCTDRRLLNLCSVFLPQPGPPGPPWLAWPCLGSHPGPPFGSCLACSTSGLGPCAFITAREDP